MRAAHDHPADFATLVLFGSYVDLGEEGVEDHLGWLSFRYRRAEHKHRVKVGSRGAVTLLWYGFQRRDWGFFTRRLDGTLRRWKSNKWFFAHGHHPCDQP